jgi:uncharacterized membrane protein
LNKRHHSWLLGELPGLIEQGILSAESAEGLRRHYADREAPNRLSVVLIIFGIAGALLIGTGIILLLSHNWAEFSRPLRTVLSILPLLASQLLVGWVLWKRKDSAAWREGSATFHVLAVGAGIALIGQTYQIPGDPGDFALTWMLLALPVIYLLNSGMAAAIYLIGITTWVEHAFFHHEETIYFLPLLVLVGPFLRRIYREKRYSVPAVLLSATLLVCLSYALGHLLSYSVPMFWTVAYMAFFATTFAVGKRWFDAAPAAWKKPFHIVGAVGIVSLAWLFTFPGIWRDAQRELDTPVHYLARPALVDFALAVLLLGMLIWLLTGRIRQGQATTLLLGLAVPVTVIAWTLFLYGNSLVPAILMNTYFLVLAVGIMAVGFRNNRLTTLNSGLLLLGVLVLARFFDTEFSLVLRGAAFILVGAAFLAANFWLLKRRSQP